MPPTPRPKLKTSAPSRAGISGSSPGSPGGNETSGSSPTASPPRRTPKITGLREKLARFYMMIGTIMVPFGRFIPQLEPIGANLKQFSDEAADAWMDLAEEDPKVKQYLESLVSASGWGNVIGIHFAIFMTAIPAQSAKIAETIMPEGVNPVEFAKSMGMDDNEISAAFRMAENMASNRPPEPPIEPIQAAQRAAEEQRLESLQQQMRGNGPAIVSPEELGVQNKGEIYDGPQNTGGIAS